MRLRLAQHGKSLKLYHLPKIERQVVELLHYGWTLVRANASHFRLWNPSRIFYFFVSKASITRLIKKGYISRSMAVSGDVCF